MASAVRADLGTNQRCPGRESRHPKRRNRQRCGERLIDGDERRCHQPRNALDAHAEVFGDVHSGEDLGDARLGGSAHPLMRICCCGIADKQLFADAQIVCFRG
jgi:hypothetical protein